jgi:SagB-type dehydrogenase family enzyme
MKDCLGQRFIGEASATIVLATDFQPTKKYYGERSYRYVAMEAGHIGENLHLQCAAIGLGTVMVGAYRDRELQQTLGIDKLPFYVMPFGEPK